MTTDKLTITMTDRAPITISKETWPIVARADWHSGEHKSQANEVAWMRVREHADGRRLVYGERDSGSGGMPRGYRGRAAGFLVPVASVQGDGPDAGKMYADGDATIRAIRRVAGLLEMGELGNELIADLPAEELS